MIPASSSPNATYSASLRPSPPGWTAAPPPKPYAAPSRQASPGEPLHHPAAFLSHRLKELLPPHLPAAPLIARPSPLQNCDGCDRAFRAPEPGRCRGCRTDLLEAA